jgi:hypothetical protein
VIGKTGFRNLRKYEVKWQHRRHKMKQIRGCGMEVKRRIKQIVKQGEGIVYMKLLSEKK